MVSKRTGNDLAKINRTMRILAVTNAYPTPEAPASGTFIEQQIKGLRNIGLTVDLLFVNRAQAGMRAYIGLRRRAREKVAEFRPAAVHVMYGGLMADIVTGAINDTPVVVSFCGSDLLGENLSGTVRKLVANYGVLASHKAAGRAAGIIVKSKDLQDALPASVARRKIRIIPNGVDLERFQPLDRNKCRQQLGWQMDAFHVLFPANGGDPVKRPELARASVNLLSHLGIHAEIHLLTGVKHDQVPVWINASDVVLLTSLQEGSPNIIKESLACNLPVVSVDVGDVRERTKGIRGCYITPPNPNDLADKLRLVYSSKRRVNGRIKMKELSLESIALQLKRLYGDLC
jgi:teichuronic acid biosynthesis glycosyltransferase TuaC